MTSDLLSASAYLEAGVNIDAGHQMVEFIRPFVRATRRPGAEGSIGGFSGIFDLKATGFKDPLLLATTDGVGTKLKIAAESRAPHRVGGDLVAMCVNDLIVHGAEPLFFLDYYATGTLNPTLGATIIETIAAACVEAGCALLGGETAEMPSLYEGTDYELAGFAVGAVERESLLPKKTLVPGDVLLGLRSSGLHANGFSLVRKIISAQGLRWNHPAPFAPAQILSEALLIPTKIYVKNILSLLKENSGVKAMAHITGGGITENLPRVLPKECGALIDLSSFSAPEVFSWIAEEGPVSREEMLRTFNCGIGFILVVNPEEVTTIKGHLMLRGEEVFEIGKIITSSSDAPQILYEGTCFPS